jgi:hypothetical protein
MFHVEQFRSTLAAEILTFAYLLFHVEHLHSISPFSQQFSIELTGNVS